MNIFQTYISYGLSCIPCGDDKRPKIAWQQYQSRLPTQAEAVNWTGKVAIICGKVSGGIVCIDFDTKNGDKYSDWVYMLNKCAPALLSKLVIETTPSGGKHVIFKTPIEIRNRKLAKNIHGKETIETRGEGGYFICAPSDGYEWEYGSLEEVQTLSEEETTALIEAAELQNEQPNDDDNHTKTVTTGNTPFDDYDSRHGVKEVLEKHGWKFCYSRGVSEYYQRPDKKGRNISASWNNVPDRLYMFTHSAQGFTQGKTYKASAVYAILEHGGNYSAAAKELAAKGYGKVEARTGKIITTNGITEKLLHIQKHGYPKGKTTGWKNLDSHYSVIKRQFTVVTGYPSHGKSSFVDAMSMNMAMALGWKFAYFSPENYPVEMHCHKLLELYAGINMHRLNQDDVIQAMEFINQHFFFIDALEDEQTLTMILNTAQALISKYKIDGLIIDPWNEIELDKPKNESTTEFIGKSLRIARKFARRNNIHLWIVVHPIKPAKDKSGQYPVPDLYSCEGSAHWRNKADNGLCVYRHLGDDDYTEIQIQKIKYKYSGSPGSIALKYSIDSGRYYETEVPETW